MTGLQQQEVTGGISAAWPGSQLTPPPVRVLVEQGCLLLPSLTADDRRAIVQINALRPQAFTVEDTLNGPCLWAGPYIGVFTLATVTVHVVPKGKVGMGNALYMLARTLGMTWELPPASLDLKQTDMQEALATLFLTSLRAELHRGLLRRSQRVQENLPVVRGRLRVAAYLRQSDPTRLPVEYTDLTSNHPVNRVFLLVLNRLSSRVSAHLRRGVAELRSWLREAGVTPLMAAPRDRHAFTLNRLHRRYQPALTLAWLLLDGWGHDQHAGCLSGVAFSFNMNTLYERFLERVLIEDVLPGTGYTGRAQRPDGQRTFLFTADTLELKPDLTIFEGADVRLIVDFKNKLPDGKPSRDDLYQMYAYARHLKCDRVLLLYPGGTVGASIHSTREPHVHIAGATVDLTTDLQKNLGALHAQLRDHLRQEGLQL